jgi:hypothetical protein
MSKKKDSVAYWVRAVFQIQTPFFHLSFFGFLAHTRSHWEREIGWPISEIADGRLQKPFLY